MKLRLILLITIILFTTTIQKTIAQTTTPSIIWATYFGSPEDDFSGNFVIDSKGNIILVSNVSGDGAPTTPEVHQTTYSGNFDVMLTKFDPSGKMIWSTYFGGNDYDYAIAIDINKLDEIVLVGRTLSTNNIASNNAFQKSLAGDSDSFIAKFSINGSLIWSTYFGGFKYDEAYEVTFDNKGDILLCGITASNTGISTSGSHQSELGLSNDGFLSKFSTDGNLIWSTYYGGVGSDFISTVRVLENNNILTVGSTSSAANISTPGSFQPKIGGSLDGMIVVFDPNGNRIYGSYLGSNLSDELYTCNSDKDGNYYVAGPVYSKGLATPGAFQTNQAGERDILLTKFNKYGNRVWATYLGGTYWDTTFSLFFDDNGDLLITAMSKSFDFPITENAYNNVYNGGVWDAVFMKMDTSGTIKWSTFFGGPYNDRAICLRRGKDGFLYGSISVESPDLATNGAFQKVIRKFDAMVVKMRDDLVINVVDLEHYPVISIYPNPTTDYLKFKDFPNHDIKNLTICSANGQVISQYINSIPELIDVSQLTPNKYWIIVEKVSGEIMSNSFIKM